MLTLYRVIACAAVVGNHSFIWANMASNVIGTGFITMLHLSRNAFFFLSGLVIDLVLPDRPHPIGGGLLEASLPTARRTVSGVDWHLPRLHSLHGQFVVG
jgi:peptidoglycan/LPS O-acetylase OafA/YrhL